MNFYDLPNDIIKHIYEFDPTFKDVYNVIIVEINLFPKFHYYDEIFGSYFFTITPCKGVYIHANVTSSNYKKAFKKAFRPRGQIEYIESD